MVEFYKEYLKLPVGEIVTDYLGIEWKRTNIRNIESSCDDNYYYMPIKCYCDIEVGGGYTYSDEHGDCDHCINAIRQIKGDNTELTPEITDFDFDEKIMFDKTKEISIYLDKKDYKYKHFSIIKGNKQMLEQEKKTKKRVFGNAIVGDWICASCHYHVFPNTLRNLQDDFVWTQITKSDNFHPCCPKCGTALLYDEAE